jgi:hypothetical protein
VVRTRVVHTGLPSRFASSFFCLVAFILSNLVGEGGGRERGGGIRVLCPRACGACGVAR